MKFAELKEKIEELHTLALFGNDEQTPCGEESEGTLDVFAEEEFLQCLAFLRIASRAAGKAHYHQVRGIAESQKRGLIG